MSSVQKQTTTRTVKQQSSETSGVTQTSTTTSRQTNRVQITQRGLFFDDACFEDTRNDFRNAISDVVSRFGDKSSNIDELTQYRSLRSREIRDENQAITSSQDDSKYKIVVDVQDFVNGGEINVKVVEEREVVVEGRVQKVEGNRTSSKSFQRSFFLPEDVDVDTLASVMSADGVLTITAIRRTVTQQLTQVPVSIQRVENRQVTTTTSTTGVQEVPVPVQPVQDTNQTVSVQKVTKITQQTTSSTDSSVPQSPEKPLPIAKKGDFFNDSFFEDTRQHFQTAVHEVLQKMNIQTANTDEISTYRNLRQRELREETQAATVNEDQTTHKVVVDVQDFINGGEVNVKVVNEREIVIEGHVEKKEGNTTSTKRFRKRYVLPEDIEVEKVTSVMSSDGVLTIKTPKKPSSQPLPEVPVSIQKIENKKTTTTTTTTGVQEIPAPVQPAQPAQPIQPSQDTDQTVSVQKVTKITQQTTSSTDSSVPQSPEKPLPIAKKGDFFNDSFFEDTRQHFQTAVHEVLQKMNIQTANTDEISTYRNLRQRELREETQAATVNEDQTTHKIVVDVQDFVNGGEVIVKIVNEREVIIEGHVEKMEGNKTSIKRFRKRYVLPENIEVEKVTSVMSSDGVLTITTPKKPSSQPLTQVTPVSIQKIENKKQETITQETKTTTDSSVTDVPSRLLTIIKKGNFFSDTFFEDCRQNFQTAVIQILKKLNIETSTVDVMTTYRTVRQRELREETQAITEKESEQVRKFVVDVQDFANGGEVTVKVVQEREVVVEGRVDRQEGGVTSTKRCKKTFILSENIQVNSVTAVMSADGILTITAPKKVTQQQQVTVEKTTDTKKEVTKEAVVQKPGEDRVLPVNKKGSFLSDPYFQDSRQDFQSSVTEVVMKSTEKDSKEDHMTIYRRLRQKTIKLENQAVSVKEDAQFQKIVLDVLDFMNGEVKVMITSENILVVEGRGTRQEGVKTSSHSFLRRFIVPDNVIPESIEATLSSDGILTIFSKKQ